MTNRPLAIALALLVLLAAGVLLRDLWQPYKSGTTLRARDFARWFWFDLAQDGELICLHTDRSDDLSPGTFQWGWSALYLCNQRIYSPRHARGQQPQLDRVSADWPLRCVLYRSHDEERDTKPRDQWLREMQTRYQLVARDSYPVPAYDKSECKLLTTDSIEVFKFIPKEPPRNGPAVTTKPQRNRSA